MQIQVSSNHDTQGRVGPHGGSNFYIGINIEKIFSKTSWPEKLKLLLEHPQIL